MITLNVEEYCHNCSQFEAATQPLILGFTAVHCVNRNLCSNLYKYLSSQIQEEKGE